MVSNSSYPPHACTCIYTCSLIHSSFFTSSVLSSLLFSCLVLFVFSHSCPLSKKKSGIWRQTLRDMNRSMRILLRKRRKNFVLSSLRLAMKSLRARRPSISSFNNNHKHKVSGYLGSLIIHLTTNIQNLKSCYNSHLISPTRLLLSVKQLKSVEEVKDKVSYGAMVWCCAVLLNFALIMMLLLNFALILMLLSLSLSLSLSFVLTIIPSECR